MIHAPLQSQMIEALRYCAEDKYYNLPNGQSVKTLKPVEWLVFEKDETSLSKCIEDYILNINDPFYKEASNAKEMADRFAKDFIIKTISRRMLPERVRNFFRKLQREKKNQIHAPVQIDIIDALIYCADDKYYDQPSTVTYFPVFGDVTSGISDILNYVLVDTIDRPFPHTYDDEELFLVRREVPYADRNTPLPSSYIYEILKIHIPDFQTNVEFDLYDSYIVNGMSSAAYYIEARIDQFYRIIFFFLELQMYGVSSDEEDTFDGPVPFDVLPDFIQAIMVDDDSYGRFLLFESRRLERAMWSSEIQFSQSLSSGRVREEDLILMMSISIKNSAIDMISTTTSTTSTTIRTPSTTQQSDGKGSVCVNKYGKHFLKRPRITFPDDCCENGDDTSDKKSRDYTGSCLRQHYNYTVTNTADKVYIICSMIRKSLQQQQQQQQVTKVNSKYYGYILRKGDPNTPLLLEPEPLVWMRILHDLVAPFGKSHHNELRRR